MIKFPAQFHNYRKTTLGDNIVSFSIDKSFSKNVVELVEKDIGTEFVVYLENVTSNTNLNEDTDELIVKFRKQMHALLSNLAELKGTTQKDEKDIIREELKKRNLIEESTKELNLKGFAIAINIINQLIEEHGAN